MFPSEDVGGSWTFVICPRSGGHAGGLLDMVAPSVGRLWGSPFKGRQLRVDSVGASDSYGPRFLVSEGQLVQKAALPLTEQHLETDPIKFKAPVRSSEQCIPDASSEGVARWERPKPVAWRRAC